MKFSISDYILVCSGLQELSLTHGLHAICLTLDFLLFKVNGNDIIMLFMLFVPSNI